MTRTTGIGSAIARPNLRVGCERVFFALEHLVTALLYPYYLLRQRWGRPIIPILMYHQVSQPADATMCEDCVSPERLELHMRAIRDAGYRVISLADLVRAVGHSSPASPARCVAITFDDGLRDQFLNAYPILRRYDFPATFFLITGYLGTEAMFPHLTPRNAGADVPPGWLPLTWDHAQTMVQHGIDIGSHSVSHCSLGSLGSDEIRREIKESKDILERRLKIPVTFFAYPFGSKAYGDFDYTIMSFLHQAGYEGACTTVVGTNGRSAERFALRRIPMEEADDAFRVRCKLVGAYNWVGTIKNAWQRLVPREDRVRAGFAATVTTDEG